MKLSRARYLVFILILAVAALWFSNLDKFNYAPPVKVEQPKDYSWQAHQTTVWTLTPNAANNTNSQQSVAQTVVVAEQVKYQENGKLSQFTKPHAYQLNKQNLTQIQSQKARGEKDNSIEFIDQVKLTQNQAESSQQNSTLTQLTTERLNYNVDQQKAYTDELVNIKSDITTSSGVGLEADLKNQTFTLKNQVNTVFNPAK